MLVSFKPIAQPGFDLGQIGLRQGVGDFDHIAGMGQAIGAPDVAHASGVDDFERILRKQGVGHGHIYAAGPDWVGSQAIGKAEDVTASVPQELGWFGQRVSEIATPFNKRRVADPSFIFSSGDVRDLSLGVPRPDINAMVVEGQTIGKKLKQVRQGGIRPEVADIAQQSAGIGQVSASTPDMISMLPPSMRTGINQDIVGATQQLSGPLSQVISSLRTPSRRAYSVALPPAVMALMQAARNRNKNADQSSATALDRMATA